MNAPPQGVRRCVPDYVYLSTGERLALPPVAEAPGELSPREYRARHGILPEWADLSLLSRER